MFISLPDNEINYSESYSLHYSYLFGFKNQNTKWGFIEYSKAYSLEKVSSIQRKECYSNF